MALKWNSKAGIGPYQQCNTHAEDKANSLAYVEIYELIFNETRVIALAQIVLDLESDWFILT